LQISWHSLPPTKGKSSNYADPNGSERRSSWKAKDSADFILSQQRQDAMNYAKQPVVKTKMVGQLFLSHKFLSSLVSWMIHSAMMHTLFHSYASPTPRQTFTFPRQMVHMPTALVASPKIGLRLLAWQHYLKGTFALPSKLRNILA
jgi:hypothetical protein